MSESSLVEFFHENGYRLRCRDLAEGGIQIILEDCHGREAGAAIILSPRTANQFVRWLASCQSIHSRLENLPEGIVATLRRKTRPGRAKPNDNRKIMRLARALENYQREIEQEEQIKRIQ